MRTVQRARLWAITWTASQAALAAKRPEGRWLRPTPCFRSLMAFSFQTGRLGDEYDVPRQLGRPRRREMPPIPP